MYFIKKITVDDKQGYQLSKIVGHTNKTVSNALLLLENMARSFIRDECGRETAEQTKIIDIYKFDQINEPVIDTMLLYRIADDPQRIHVYQKKTIIVKAANWTWGTTETPIKQFRRTHIFELEEYDNLKNIDIQNENIIIIPQIEMVPIGPAKIKIPKPMTVSPMCDLLDELKKSIKFKARYDSVNSSAISSPIVNSITEKTDNLDMV